MQSTLPYHNHHTLAYADYGDPGGYPVLVQHGLIASIREAGLFNQLTALGARVICVARPGYGASSPYRMKNMAEWGEIAAVLVDRLQLEQFDVFGISSGAPYAYALGQRFPERVRHIFILSGTPALFARAVQAHWPYPVNPQAGLPELQALAEELFFAHLPPAALAAADVRDARMNACFGIAQDLHLRCSDWGFRLEELIPPVLMRHSRADAAVPWITAQITAGLLRSCQLELTENAEHFSQAVLDDFITTTLARHIGK